METSRDREEQGIRKQGDWFLISNAHLAAKVI